MGGEWRRRAVSAVLAALLAALSLQGVAGAANGRGPERGRVQTFAFPSRLVDPMTPGGNLPEGQQVPKVHVLLPAGYRQHPKREYPVLWLLHGAGEGSDRWMRDFSDQLTTVHAIVVMPDGGRFGMYTDWWNGGRRGDPAWATYHLQRLRKVVERRYRIRPERRWHAIVGISMGGQGALRYAALLPGYFGSAAAMSAAFPDMRSTVAVNGLTGLATVNGAKGATYESIFGPVTRAYAAGNSPQVLVPNLEHTRVYTTSGDGTSCPEDPTTPGLALDAATESAIHAQVQPFADAARAAGADVTATTTCGVHTLGVWTRALQAVREWGLFASVPEHPRQWTYLTVAASGAMWGLQFRFREPPALVTRFTREGRKLSTVGEGRVVITGPNGCRVTFRLPVETTLPPACRRSG